MPKNNENIILVDPHDRKIRVIEKLLAHEYGMLHRAFSVFIFRSYRGKIEVLLQKRSKKKYHGGGLWTNTCCSHPHVGEKIKASAEARLKEEMGIETKLKKVGKFHYIAQLDHGMTENEIDHVFVGTLKENHDIRINPHEVDQYQWMNVQQLNKDLMKHPRKYTPWLKEALQLAIKGYKTLNS